MNFIKSKYLNLILNLIFNLNSIKIKKILYSIQIKKFKFKNQFHFLYIFYYLHLNLFKTGILRMKNRIELFNQSNKNIGLIEIKD